MIRMVMSLIMKVLIDLIFDVIDMNTARDAKKISKKLMPIAWHPTRWWGWCMSED